MTARIPPGRRGPALVAGLAALPLAAGACLAAAGAAHQGGPVTCPFRALTGVPCPLCGATRATVLLMSGDGAVWSYNFFWPVLLALVVVAGMALAVGGVPARLGRALARHQLALALTLLAAGWVVALVNRGAILA